MSKKKRETISFLIKERGLLKESLMGTNKGTLTNLIIENTSPLENLFNNHGFKVQDQADTIRKAINNKDSFSLATFNSFLCCLFDGIIHQKKGSSYTHDYNDFLNFYNSISLPTKYLTHQEVKKYNIILEEISEKCTHLRKHNLKMKSNWEFIEKSEDIDLDFSLFHYVATLDRFSLPIPITLIEKLKPKEWNSRKTLILRNNYKDKKIESYVDSETNIPCLKLTNKGKDFAQSIDFDDALIFHILDSCDDKTYAEKELFNSITLKKYYFFALFKDFTFDFNNLIYSNSYPSTYKKILYYRLMGFYFTELGDYDNMRQSFKQCINLLRIKNSEKSSSFYLNWAECELKLKADEEKVIEIYDLVLKDLPLNKNRTARFFLSNHYYKNNNVEKALSYWTIDNFKLLEDYSQFINVFYENLVKFINKNPKEATKFQEFIIKLLYEYRNRGYLTESNIILEEVNKKVKNNYKLKKALIYNYFKSDKEKALDIIKSLETNKNISPEITIKLRMDYFLEIKNPSLAIWYGKDSIENKNIKIYSEIYKKIGDIYFHYENNLKEAKHYYEKLSDEELNSYYKYAITLFRISPKLHKNKIFVIFRNFFENNPLTTNTKAIGVFVTYCLKYGKLKYISKFIFNKIQEINSNKNVNNYFISFLYQQQLKLTTNHEQTEILLKSALEYSEGEKQKAIVYSNFGRYLMYRGDDNNLNNSHYDLQEAIEYLKISNKYNDDLTNMDIAKCYFKIGEYKNCIDYIDLIKDKKLFKDKMLLKLDSLSQLKDFNKIERITTSVKNKYVKGYGYYYLTKNWRLEKEKRKEYFLKSIDIIRFNHKIKLEFAVFCFKNNNKKYSRSIIEKIKYNKNEDQKIAIESEYLKKINTRIPKAYLNTIKKIQKNIEHLNKNNFNILNGIESLIKKYPLDIELNKLKFNYFFKLNKFNECYDVLNILIKDNLINPKTSSIFLSFAHSQYTYSLYHSTIKPPNRQRQVVALTKAFRAMEYVLKVNPSPDNIALYSIIPYKQGNFKKHIKILKSFRKKLTKNDYISVQKKVTNLKRKIRIFLWENRGGYDYYDKLLFYRRQERLAANILRTSQKKKYRLKAVNILISISLDTSFHEENNYYLLENINTRLGHYYYYYENNYSQALYYNKKVYKTKLNDISFIRAFLKNINETIDEAQEYKEALKICDFYLNHIQIPTLYRYQGNWLKEIKKYKESYKSYLKALDMFDENSLKTMIHNNIILLCFTSTIENSTPFTSLLKIKEIAQNSFREIIKLEPNYKYRDETFEKLNLILSSKVTQLN